jgi:hypothetical protein
MQVIHVLQTTRNQSISRIIIFECQELSCKNPTGDEWRVYRSAIRQGLPTMRVSHENTQTLYFIIW